MLKGHLILTASISRGTIYNLFPILLIKTNNQELDISFLILIIGIDILYKYIYYVCVCVCVCVCVWDLFVGKTLQMRAYL